MQYINQIYINGAFVTPHGEELFDLFNPATGQRIGQVRLANEQDALDAIAAAKGAFTEFSHSSKDVRIDYLKRLHAAVESIEDALTDAIIEEYGAPISRARWMARHAASVLQDAASVLENYNFSRRIGIADGHAAAGCGRLDHTLEQQRRFYLRQARCGVGRRLYRRDQTQ